MVDDKNKSVEAPDELTPEEDAALDAAWDKIAKENDDKEKDDADANAS